MKTLYILRHAKSSWAEQDISDFERPLNERGLAAAPFMGELMSEEGFHPEIILSSPARRARETAERLKRAGGLHAPVVFDDHIYEASPQALLNVIAGIEPQIGSAMIVGHNPGIEGLIRFLTARFESMPTAALAVVDLDVEDWSSVQSGRGTLRRLVRPRDEMA